MSLIIELSYNDYNRLIAYSDKFLDSIRNDLKTKLNMTQTDANKIQIKLSPIESFAESFQISQFLKLEVILPASLNKYKRKDASKNFIQEVGNTLKNDNINLINISTSIDCKYTWNTWSPCDEPCGGGTQTRTLNITQQPTFDGEICPPSTEVKSCNTSPCPNTPPSPPPPPPPVTPSIPVDNSTPSPQNCQYSWDDWSVCSETCGGGTQTRTLNVTQQAAYGGIPCPSPSTEIQSCNTSPCQEITIVPWSDNYKYSYKCSGKPISNQTDFNTELNKIENKILSQVQLNVNQRNNLNNFFQNQKNQYELNMPFSLTQPIFNIESNLESDIETFDQMKIEEIKSILNQYKCYNKNKTECTQYNEFCNWGINSNLYETPEQAVNSKFICNGKCCCVILNRSLDEINDIHYIEDGNQVKGYTANLGGLSVKYGKDCSAYPQFCGNNNCITSTSC
jgi:hypothetical protein